MVVGRGSSSAATAWATPSWSWASSPASTSSSTRRTPSSMRWPARAPARPASIPAPMNHRLVAEEVAYILDHSDAAAVFVSDQFLPVVEAVRAEARKVRHWILVGEARREWAVHLDDLLARGQPRAGRAARRRRLRRVHHLHGRHHGKAQGRAAPQHRPAGPDGDAARHGCAGPEPRAPGGRAHVSLGAERLRPLRPHRRRHRGDHAQVRPGARAGGDRAPPVLQHLHGAHPAQAHHGSARIRAGPLRRIVHEGHHHGGGAVSHEREGGGGERTSARRSTSSTARPSWG